MDSNILLRYLKLSLCAECKEGSLRQVPNIAELACGRCGRIYPIFNSCPVILRADNPLFTVESYRAAKPNMSNRWSVPYLSKSVNLSRTRILKSVRGALDVSGKPKVVLVVGGGTQRKELNAMLGANTARHDVFYSDIDVSADVDLFCDAHDLPFADGVVDAVLTTAVLEHVMYPERVAAEICRVLKTGGLIYSELPFMQQVHEGAYDFTRYSLSGHRRLFNAVRGIESGLVAGPGTALVWSIENFVLAFVRGRLLRNVAKGLVRLVFGWFKYTDYMLAQRSEAMDGAACTFVFGFKAENPVTDAEIIDTYTGAKHLKHT